MKIKIFDWNLSEIRNPETLEQRITLREVSKYGVFSGLYFPTFGLNTEGYFVSFHIQYECGKYGPEKTPYLDNFHAVLLRRFLTLFNCFGFSNYNDLITIFGINHRIVNLYIIYMLEW